MNRKTLPALLLFAAAGVATGATIMHYVDTGAVAWSRALSTVVLLVLAFGARKYAHSSATAGR